MPNFGTFIPPAHLHLARTLQERAALEKEAQRQAPPAPIDPSTIPLQFKTLSKSPGPLLLDARRQGGPAEITEALNDRCARLFSALVAQMQGAMLAPPEMTGYQMKNTSRPAHEDYITIERSWDIPYVPAEGQSPSVSMTLGLGRGRNNLQERKKLLNALIGLYSVDFGGRTEWKDKVKNEKEKMLPTSIELVMDSRSHKAIWTEVTMGSAKDSQMKTQYEMMFHVDFEKSKNSFADMMPILDIVMQKIKGHTGGALSSEAQMLIAEIRVLQRAKATSTQVQETMRDPHHLIQG